MHETELVLHGTNLEFLFVSKTKCTTIDFCDGAYTYITIDIYIMFMMSIDF